MSLVFFLEHDCLHEYHHEMHSWSMLKLLDALRGFWHKCSPLWGRVLCTKFRSHWPMSRSQLLVQGQIEEIKMSINHLNFMNWGFQIRNVHMSWDWAFINNFAYYHSYVQHMQLVSKMSGGLFRQWYAISKLWCKHFLVVYQRETYFLPTDHLSFPKKQNHIKKSPQKPETNCWSKQYSPTSHKQ
jgi:hypothetical protein